MSKWPEGTIVRLKSGSPPLIVENLREDDSGIVDVVWFVGGEVKRDAFHQDALVVVTE